LSTAFAANAQVSAQRERGKQKKDSDTSPQAGGWLSVN
jgi:hypothetical protein